VDAAMSKAVRQILYTGDRALALAAAQSLDLAGPLQQVGELVLLALDHDAAEAAEFAARCSEALRARGNDGDDDLADAIDGARGIGRTDAVLLEEIPVDLDELGNLIDGGMDNAGGRVDLTTGEVWPESVLEYSSDYDADIDDPDHWLHVSSFGSGAAYHDMVAFTATRTNRVLATRLERALEGRGSFRRFKDVLSSWPDDREEWFAFSEDRRRGRAREWLAGAGYRPALPEFTARPDPL
jgi:hypothetical protein